MNCSNDRSLRSVSSGRIAAFTSSRRAATARTHRSDEQLRMQRLLAAAAMDRHGAPGVIDEQLLAGEVTLAHRALQALSQRR
jgi:hypothetical protein